MRGNNKSRRIAVAIGGVGGIVGIVAVVAVACTRRWTVGSGDGGGGGSR